MSLFRNRLYSMSDIQLMIVNDNTYLDEIELYDILEPSDNLKTSENLYPFCNTVILEALYRLKEKTISDKDFNDILNMIDTYVYSVDLLGLPNVYNKINNEIVVEMLRSQPFIGVLHDTN